MVIIWVPNNHPMAGHSFELSPASGATTYTDGTVKFESQYTLADKELRAALLELRETLDAIRR